MSTDENLLSEPGFSLVRGGPFFQLLRRAHLADDEMGLLHRRIIAISSFCWLPLLVLSMLEAKLSSGTTGIPFLKDFEAHIRFLVAMPLLISAELVVHLRFRFLVKQFLERHLISESATAQFNAAVASTFRLRNSVWAEAILVAFVYIVGIWIIWSNFLALDTATWHSISTGEERKLSLAGMWYGYISLPIFQFLLCRWYYRLFIWSHFLWKISRIDVRLLPAHPDRVGGLGFLAITVYAFIPLLNAHGALVAGLIGNRIYHLGSALPDFNIEISAIAIILMIVMLGPFLVFTPQLSEAKRRGDREYGTLAEKYVRSFDAKWLAGGVPRAEPLLGSADIQSLADLGNSLEVIHSMRVVLFTKEAVIQLAAATIVPVLPLLLTMMPLKDLLKKLAGIFF